MKRKAMAIGARTRISYCALAIMTIILSVGENTMAQTKSTAVVKNIVLVHGGLVDGSGWKDVYKILKKDGYSVAIVQEPTISLPDDVAVTKRVIDGQNGPVLLVGHSYGGSVITEAGNDPKVAGLVYVAAFAPDKGELTLDQIKANPTPVGTGLRPDASGFFKLSGKGISEDLAPDLPEAAQKVLIATQGPTAG